MFFPRLFELTNTHNASHYNAKIIASIDDYLGDFEAGTVFKESDLNFYINDVRLTAIILADLIAIKIIEEEIDDVELFEEKEVEDVDKHYKLLLDPNKRTDAQYEEYIKKKRQIDSFSIIYEKTKAKNAGALTLIDLKGYSKNVNNKDNNPAILLLIQKIQQVIDDCIKPYFLNSYSGIEIKHNGDGWFLYFLDENESYNFLTDVIEMCRQHVGIAKDFQNLNTTLKCYIHHADEIENIYKVDTLHFDMEGRDVILIHMLEKPIEKALYDNVIATTSDFIAITDGVMEKLAINTQGEFNKVNVVLDARDSEGNSKLHRADIKVFYKEFKRDI